MTRFSLHGRPGLRTAVWSQVKVCERRLCLRPIGYTPALSVTQKRRCSCGIRLVALYKCHGFMVLCICLSLIK